MRLGDILRTLGASSPQGGFAMPAYAPMPSGPMPEAQGGPLDPSYVVQGLVERGMPLPAALGFAGNFAVESGFDPGINEIAPLVEGSRGGFGLSQWTGPRRRQLEAFAQERGLPVSDPDLQLDFLMWELDNTEAGARGAIYSAADPLEAARLVSERFLRPGIPHLDRRLEETQRIAGMDFGATTTGPTGPSTLPMENWGQQPPAYGQGNALAALMPPQPGNAMASLPFLRPQTIDPAIFMRTPAQQAPLYGLEPGQHPFM